MGDTKKNKRGLDYKNLSKGLHKRDGSKAIKDGEHMIKLYLEYREWCLDNPIIDKQPIQRTGTVLEIERERPPSNIGFDAYLGSVGVCTNFKSDYCNNTNGNYNEYKEAVAYIKASNADYQISGALVGVLKENLVGKLQGLTDKSEITEVKKKFVVGKRRED